METETIPGCMKVHRRLAALGAALLAMAVLGSGCGGFAPVYGLVYTHVTLPHTVDLDETPSRSPASGTSAQITLSEPLSGYGLSARTRSTALADAAAEQGITRIDYADQEVFSLLFGIFKTTTIHVYGETTP